MPLRNARLHESASENPSFSDHGSALICSHSTHAHSAYVVVAEANRENATSTKALCARPLIRTLPLFMSRAASCASAPGPLSVSRATIARTSGDLNYLPISTARHVEAVR